MQQFDGIKLLLKCSQSISFNLCLIEAKGRSKSVGGKRFQSLVTQLKEKCRETFDFTLFGTSFTKVLECVFEEEKVMQSKIGKLEFGSFKHLAKKLMSRYVFVVVHQWQHTKCIQPLFVIRGIVIQDVFGGPPLNLFQCSNIFDKLWSPELGAVCKL